MSLPFFSIYDFSTSPRFIFVYNNIADVCRAADILIVVDASDTIPSEADWSRAKNLTMEIVQNLGQKSKNYHFAVMTYGSTPTIDISFDSEKDIYTLLGQISNLPKKQGSPGLNLALTSAREDFFQVSYSLRHFTKLC